MKKHITQLHNYLVNRITNCDFDSVEVSEKDGWFSFKSEIEGLTLNFSINPSRSLYCSHDSDFRVEVPYDRLKNLVEWIGKQQEKLKKEKIERLQNELKQLQVS